MKHSILFLAVSSLLLFGCNGGMDPTLADVKPESDPIVADPGTPTPTPNPSATPAPSVTPSPTATPNPSPTATPVPSPTPVGKNRVFVTNALVTGINLHHSFEKVCEYEAKKAKLSGKYTALTAYSSYVFSKKYPITGYIYQKANGAEYVIAKSFDELVKGNNGDIFANAFQKDIRNTSKDLVWTGQKDLNQPSQADLNCTDWSMDEGWGIVGRIGRPGSEAIATQYQRCDILARLYCIQYH